MQTMEKMDSAAEQRIMRSLLSVVDKTKAGADPIKTMVKVASEQGYNPQIISRMCEAYNKAKSVHMLQKTSSDRRADSFPIVNARDVINQVFEPTEKTAGEFRKVPNLLTVDFSSRTLKRMEKSASDRMFGPNPLDKKAGEVSGVPDGTGPHGRGEGPGKGKADGSGMKKKDEKEDKENFDLIYDRLKKKETREKAEVEKHASDIRQQKIRIEKNINTLADILRPMSNKQIKKVAQQVFNKYDKKGDQLLSVVYAKLNKEKPEFEKTAKTTIFPLDEPFVSVVRAMEGYREYKELTTAQKKIEKQARIGDILAAAGMPSMSEAALGVAQTDPLEDKGGDNILGASLSNKLKTLDTVDTFYDVYTEDEFLRDKPVDDVLKAFNTVTSLMPSLLRDDNKRAYIPPLVKKLVSEGNRLDPLDIGRLSSIEADLAKGNKARMEETAILEQLRDTGKNNQPGIGEATIQAALAKGKVPKQPSQLFSRLSDKGSKAVQAVASIAGKGAHNTGKVSKEIAESSKDKKDKKEQRKPNVAPVSPREKKKKESEEDNAEKTPTLFRSPHRRLNP